MSVQDQLESGNTSISVFNLNVTGTATGTFPGSGGFTTGTWVPQLQFNDSSAGIAYAGTPTGTWAASNPTMPGGLVFITGQFQCSSIGSFAGDAIPTIIGLPYAQGVLTVGAATCPGPINCAWSNVALDTSPVYTTVYMQNIPTTTTMALAQAPASGSAIALYWQFCTNTMSIFFSGFYFV